MRPPGYRESAQQKLAKLAVARDAAPRRKPPWIRVSLTHGGRAREVRGLLRELRLHTVCEEARCPNLPECFGRGTATFMILGDLCTRRCAFCAVDHGRPLPPDPEEPERLARAIASLDLRYAVLTSVDRDDLRDGGADHFARCISALRAAAPGMGIEILVPDFRGRAKRALEVLRATPPDVFNHNIETVPRLYRTARPGADYGHSLQLLADFARAHPDVPAKSGLMLGLGETTDEVRAVLRDLREARCRMLTLGQYLQPTRHHLPVQRYVTPAEFSELAREARALGFCEVASGPMVRSSYRADLAAAGIGATSSSHAPNADSSS